MLARRLTIPIVVLLFALPASSALAGNSAPDPAPAFDHPASRADVNSGHATDAQTVSLFQASIEAAGGETVDVASDENVLGGYAYPLLATDLDGDGDDEVLVEQFAGRAYVVALDGDEILWRERQPRKSYLIGVLPGDLFQGGGQEVLLATFRWKTDTVLLAAAGSQGVRWVASFPSSTTELNGLVQADGDPENEIAVSVRDEESYVLSIATYDGDTGMQISSLSPSLEKILGEDDDVEGFVTDGPDGSPDEAVFLTPLEIGYYAERLNLADGSQTDYNLVPTTEQKDPALGQGLDFTGDGKRDGYIMDYVVEEDTSISQTVGVFDASELKLLWSKTLPGSNFFGDYLPFAAGDANGDGGQDLCQFTHEDAYDPDTDEDLSSTSAFTCFAGATGNQLWTASRSVDAPDSGWSHTYGYATSDLNGDGVLDPVLDQEFSACTWSPDGAYDCDFRYSATAHSGKDGSALWNVDDPDSWSLPYDLTDSDLDDAAGDDGLEQVYRDDRPTETRFAVINGLSLQRSWEGVIDTGTLEDSYVDGALAADLDGDGSTEILLLADAYQGIGEPTCEVWDDEEYCWYEDYEEHAFAAAFEPGGERLWQMEL